MTPKIVKKKYKIPLTQSELVDYGSQAGEIHKTLSQVQFESKNAAEGYKDKISGIKDDFSEVMTKIREKKEWRDLDCEEHADYEKKEMSWTFNGEVMEVRAMNDYELQMKLPVPPPVHAIQELSLI